VTAKLREAMREPIWKPLAWAGTLTRSDTSWAVTSDSGLIKVNLRYMPAVVARLAGHDVVAEGVARTADIIDVTRMAERSANTLDLFVMSQCPYAKLAEKAAMARMPKQPDLKLRVHYILYRTWEGDSPVYSSMHGESELTEDVVQILVRDTHPRVYHDYLRLRAESDVPWRTLASRAGLSSAEIERIATRSLLERDELLRMEFDTVAGLFAVHDGSPTYVWQGVPIQSLRDVPGTAPDSMETGSCSTSTHAANTTTQ
jgi:hypothetical protein